MLVFGGIDPPFLSFKDEEGVCELCGCESRSLTKVSWEEHLRFHGGNCVCCVHCLGKLTTHLDEVRKAYEQRVKDVEAFI